MTLPKIWKKGKPAISAPEKVVHTGHGSHDEITQKLQGLPPEWIAILRENGVVGEDLVLPRRNGAPYSNGLINLSSSSFLSNRSLQKLWSAVSGKSRRSSVDDGDASIEALKSLALQRTSSVSAEVQRGLHLLQDTTPTSSVDTASRDATQPPSISRQSNAESLQEDGQAIDQIARDCGLTFRHDDFSYINPNLFEVVDSLGHGSLGVVEEVRVTSEHKSFVRKRVQIPYYRRKQYLKIINQEAKVLQSLSHAHIVRMIGSYSEDSGSGRQFYSLLMAPVGQCDLRTFLDEVGDKNATHSAHWYDARKTWLRSWFKCLSSALAYLHDQGVRHQDIKPSTIVHRESAIYFTDFSSASQFQIGQTTSTENPARTSAMYAAPEVVDSGEGLNRHGRATDVFALGAVFTEMLAVLCGSSIEDYQRFLAKTDGGRHEDASHPAARQSLIYARKLWEMEAFFGEEGFFELCISNMLLPDREQRPDAKEVAKQIRTCSPWELRSCVCDADVT